MKTKRNKRVEAKRTTRAARLTNKSQPFSAHLLELRRRLTWCAISVAFGASLAYSVQQHLVTILLRPAGNQEFIYTSPGGGLNFLVQICIYSGVVFSVPVIIYNILKFIEPVMPSSSTQYILRGSAVAGFLALAGIVFGYHFGLPSALKFLAHQFTTDQIKALIAVQSYMSFVTKFLLASALIFQAPLIMLLINRIKPMNPRKLISMQYQRWVILISFILGAVISPTPDIRSMMILSVPMMLSFDIGIAVVWHSKRRAQKPKSLLALLEQDMAARAERLRVLESALVMQFEQPELVPVEVIAESVDNTSGEVVASGPIDQPTEARSDGRTNYQYTARGSRVRRRMFT